MSANHLVQFYQRADAIVEGICDFVAAGFEEGEAAIVAAVPRRLKAVRAELATRGCAEAADRLLCVDAGQAALDICPGGRADEREFRKLALPALKTALSRSRARRARVYGEIVDVLWAGGHQRQALELEGFWTRLGAEQPFTLLCGYGVDPISSGADADRIAQTHDLVQKSPELAAIDGRVEGLLTKHLGSKAGMVHSLVDADPRLRRLPFDQAALFWLRSHMPIVAEKIVKGLDRRSKARA